MQLARLKFFLKKDEANLKPWLANLREGLKVAEFSSRKASPENEVRSVYVFHTPIQFVKNSQKKL